MRKLVAGVLVIAITFVGLCGAVGAATTAERHDRIHSQQAERAATIRSLERFVERARGLKFTRPVPVHFETDREFDALEASKEKLEPANFTAFVRTFQALHLPTPSTTALAKRYDQGELGVYMSKTRDLFVRGTSLDPFERSVIANELTHALDDQHFNFLRISKYHAGEFTALLEGDARHVERRYVVSLAPGDRKAYERERSALGARISPLPYALDHILFFRYELGARFVTALQTSGGQTAVNRAFSELPLYDGQIIHPSRYLDDPTGNEILATLEAIPYPEAVDGVDGIAWHGWLGEEFIQFALAPVLGLAKARSISALVDGDHTTVWYDGRRACVADTIHTTTPANAQRLDGALHTWALASANVTVTSGPGTYEGFTSCA